MILVVVGQFAFALDEGPGAPTVLHDWQPGSWPGAVCFSLGKTRSWDTGDFTHLTPGSVALQSAVYLSTGDIRHSLVWVTRTSAVLAEAPVALNQNLPPSVKLEMPAASFLIPPCNCGMGT